MSQDGPKVTSNEIKILFQSVQESLPEIQALILAPIAFSYAILERLTVNIAKNQLKIKKDAELRFQQAREDKAKQILEEQKAKRILAELKGKQLLEERKVMQEEKIAEEKFNLHIPSPESLIVFIDRND